MQILQHISLIQQNEFGAHYLDLLNHRDISNDIAERFEVQHQSPQLIVIKDGKAIAHVISRRD